MLGNATFTLSMTFATADDKKLTVSISQVKPDIDEDTIEAAMNAVIENPVFKYLEKGEDGQVTGRHALTKKVKAELVAKEVTKYEF